MTVATDAGTPDAVMPDDAKGFHGLVVTHALFGGIMAWMVHLIGIAWMTGRACATGQIWPAHLLTIVTMAITVHALWTGWRIAHPEASSPRVDAMRLLGWLAVVLNVFNVVLIVAEWAPVLVLDPCAVL